jgi:asparagine synthase (glutamine-hydrolysing)
LQKTFSSCFDDPQYDERQYINIVASQTKTDNHYIFPDEKELIRVLEKIVWYQDEPFNSTSIYAQWKVFNEARLAGVKVMLDGQGGDELLYSYPEYFYQFIMSLIIQEKISKVCQEYISLKELHNYKLKKILSGVVLGIIPSVLYNLFIDKVSKSYHYSALNMEFWESMGCDLSLPNQYILNINRKLSTAEVSQLLITDLTLPMLLHWEDRNSMANSVEARIPFLDYRLVELTLSLPDSLKIRRGLTKRILRDALSDLIPAPILGRYDKMGFITPEKEWIKGGLSGLCRDRLTDMAQTLPNLFHSRKLEALVNGITYGDIPFNNFFWRMLSFGSWAKVFNVGY